MPLTDPDIFAPAVDTPAVNALLTAIPTPPAGKRGETPSGAWPIPLDDSGGSERRKELKDLKAERQKLQGQLRSAMDSVGQRPLPRRDGPTLPQRVMASFNNQPLPEDPPSVPGNDASILPTGDSGQTGDLVTGEAPEGSQPPDETPPDNLFPVNPNGEDDY